MSQLKLPTEAEFKACLNQFFLLQLDGFEAIKMELINLESMRPNNPGDDSRQSFSVMFQGPMEPRLNQGIYALENESMGRIEIFLVPIETNATGVQYEAIFN